MSTKRIFQSKSLPILASLALAAGLIGLLWAFMPRLAVESQTLKPGLAVDLPDDAVWGQVVPDDTTPVAHTSASASSASISAPIPPRNEREPPDSAPPHDWRMPLDIPPHLSPAGGSSMSDTAAAGTFAGSPSMRASAPGRAFAGQSPGLRSATGALNGDGFVVDLAYDAAWGYVAPGDVVTVTRTADGAYGAAEADGVGFFWTPLWQSNGQPADVTGGDTIEIYVNGALATTLNPSDITGQVDVLSDQVVGAISGDAGGTPVTVTLGIWAAEPLAEAPQFTTNTDAGGTFTADFGAAGYDVGPHNHARVEYAASPDTVQGYLYPSQVFEVDTFTSLFGYATPGQLVTVTIYVTETSKVRWRETTTANKPHGDYGTQADIQPGDVVEVDLGGSAVITTVASNLTAYIDVDNERVTGACPPNETVRVWAHNWLLGAYVETVTTADASGNYTATFTGYDLKASDSVFPAFADDEGNEVLLSTAPPRIIADPGSNRILGSGDAPNAPYTATLYHAPDTYVETGATQLGHSTGWVDFGVDIAPGDVITLETATWEGSMTVADLGFDADTAGDRVLGDADIPGWAMAWARQQYFWLYPARGRVGVSTNVSSSFTATFTGFDLRDGCFAQVRHYDANDFCTQVQRDLRSFVVDFPWGVSVPQFSDTDVLTATLYESDGVTIKRQTSQDDDGNPDWYWLDLASDIEPGDWVTVTDNAGWTAGLQVPTLTIQADPDSDLVWGQAPQALLFVEHSWDGGWDGRFVPGGDYALDRSHFGGDIQQDDWIAVNYQALNGNRVRRQVQWLTLEMRVNYGHDWIEGNYEAGHTLWLTVTESDGSTVKATAELQTQEIPWWSGETTGFSTNLDNPWIPDRPDIEAGDWVTLLADNGQTSTVRVGTITGDLDVDADTVSGTIHADWFTQTLNAWCGVWEESGPGQSFLVAPDGGSYSCDFGAMGWDLLPGQNVAVQYQEPDGDWVINVFQHPRPYLSISKEASGNPSEGGNFAFNVQYWNNGEGDAENTVITDTMLGGMTYVTDTSSLIHTGSGAPGDPIVWHLGDLPASSSGAFDVFVQITAVESDTITNTVQIATSNPYDQGDPGEKESGWSGHVEANDTHLNVGKWAWTGDPAPDTDVVFSVNVCNNGSTASSQVTLTDMLHPSMTLQYWWGQHPGWTEVDSNDNWLVVSRLTIPGWWCSEVYLRVHLDGSAWSGMSITNTAVISASNDLEAGDNVNTWWSTVSDPHTNLSIDKWWAGGQLTPGGRIRYHGQYNNNGNVPVDDIVITETLPVSTTLVQMWHYDHYGNLIGPITPILVPPDHFVWDVGTVDNGYQGSFEINLLVDNDAVPGMVLTNTVEISSQQDEDDYSDNVSTWAETLYDHGPNLRVRKEGSWDDWGEDTRRASYKLTVENVGDAAVTPVVVTDTYDSRMYLDGDVGTSYWRWWEWRDDPANHLFTVTLEALYGGESVNINFGAITDTEPLPFGLIFTNTAEVTLDPDDTDPDDNSDAAILTTGPDLYVEKTLVGGDLLPGEIITFSLAFGNKHEWHEWWWDMQGDAWLTDTLPAVLEFITATLQSCGWCPLTPDFEDGTHYAWDIDAMWTGYQNEIYLTARITDTAEGDNTFTNWVEIASDQPRNDIEPYYSNNEDSYDVAITLPKFELSKFYESSRVAGMPVTYTLTVTNTGNEPGANVMLSDTLPAGLTYGGSDGTPVGGDVTWTLSIAAKGGTATGWFSGTLPCAGAITNDNYRVVGSDEGVDSLPGAPVAFNVIAPTLGAAFDVSTEPVVVSTTITFTDTSTTNGMPIVGWEWDFGDGSPHVFAKNADHQYDLVGTFTVRLTVTDTCGYTATVTHDVYVTSGAVAVDELSFDYNPIAPTVNSPVTFTAIITPSTATPPITYTWNFGDGGTGSGQTVQHTYAVSGTYMVAVTATNVSSVRSYSQVVTVAQIRIFLPLILRNS